MPGFVPHQADRVEFEFWLREVDYLATISLFFSVILCLPSGPTISLPGPTEKGRRWDWAVTARRVTGEANPQVVSSSTTPPPPKTQRQSLPPTSTKVR